MRDTHFSSCTIFICLYYNQLYSACFIIALFNMTSISFEEAFSPRHSPHPLPGRGAASGPRPAPSPFPGPARCSQRQERGAGSGAAAGGGAGSAMSFLIDSAIMVTSQVAGLGRDGPGGLRKRPLGLWGGVGGAGGRACAVLAAASTSA